MLNANSWREKVSPWFESLFIPSCFGDAFSRPRLSSASASLTDHQSDEDLEKISKLKTTDKKIFVQALICRTKLWTEPWFFLSKEFRKKKKVDLDSGKTCRRGTCALLLCSLGQRSPLIRRTSTVQRCMWMMTIRKMCWLPQECFPTFKVLHLRGVQQLALYLSLSISRSLCSINYLFPVMSWRKKQITSKAQSAEYNELPFPPSMFDC